MFVKIKSRFAEHPAAAIACAVTCTVMLIYLLLVTEFQYTRIEPATFRHGMWGVGIYMTAVFILAVVITVWHQARPEKLAAILVPLMGLAYMFVSPFDGVPDEIYHIPTVYRISNYVLGWEPFNSFTPEYPMRADDARLTIAEDALHSGKLSAIVSARNTRAEYVRYWQQFGTPLTDGTPATASFESLDPHRFPVYQYLGPAIGMTVGRLIGLGTFDLFTFSRLTSLALYTVITVWTMSVLPFKKMLFLILLLTPTSVHQGMGITYDSLTNGLSFLMIAVMLRLIYAPPETKKMRIRYHAVLIISALLLAPCKQGAFVFFLLLPWYTLYRTGVIPKKWFWGINVGVLLVGCAGVIFILGRHFSAYYGPAETADFFFRLMVRAKQIVQSLIANGGYFLERLMFNSIAHTTSAPMPIVGFLLLLVLALGQRKDETFSLTSLDRLVCVLLFLGTFAGVCTAFFYRTGYDDQVMSGVQGRYLMPIILPLLLAVQNNSLKADERIDRMIVPSAVFLNYVAMIYVLVTTPVIRDWV